MNVDVASSLNGIHLQYVMKLGITITPRVENRQQSTSLVVYAGIAVGLRVTRYKVLSTAVYRQSVTNRDLRKHYRKGCEVRYSASRVRVYPTVQTYCFRWTRAARICGRRYHLEPLMKNDKTYGAQADALLGIDSRGDFLQKWGSHETKMMPLEISRD